MKLVIKEVENLILFGGVITQLRDGSGNAKDRLVAVKLCGKEYDGSTGKEVDKTVEIELWNSDDDTRQLADRAKKAKLSVGKFVTILANKTKNSKLYAVNFKYSGRYQFKERNGHGECNVFIGSLGNVAERDNQVSTSIPVTENGVTIWYPIVFYNDEADEATGRKRNMLADAAKKCFIERNEHRPKIAVVTGPNRPYIDREGTQRLSYKAFRFEMLPKEGYKSE